MAKVELKPITRDHPHIQIFIEVERMLGTAEEEIDQKVEVLVDELKECPSTEDYEKAIEKRGRPKKKKKWRRKEKKKKFVVPVEDVITKVKNDAEINKTLDQEFPRKKRGRPREFKPISMLCLIIWTIMETFNLVKAVEQLTKFPILLGLLGLPKVPSERTIRRYFQLFEEKGLLKRFFYKFMYLSSPE